MTSLSNTATLITCTDCGAGLRRDADRIFQLCNGCMSRWFALAVVGTPSRIDAKAAGAAQRAENRALGDYFEDDDPIPGERDLSTTGEVQASLVEHQTIQRDAAREAAHGASVEDELREVGPEPSDACPKCGGDGWRPDHLGGHFWVECDCQAASS